MNMYESIQKIVEELRQGSRNFEQMLKWLRDSGMGEGEAERMLDRLMKQVEDE